MSFTIATLLPLALYAAPGDRSKTFGTAGIARDGGVAFADGGERVLAQPDGKVVMVGFRRALSGADTNRKVSVWRFNLDASRDTGFGPGGSGQATVVLNSATDDVGAAVLQPDGKILVAGSRIHPSINAGKPFWLVTRFTATGDLDVSFGGSGSRDYVIDANAVIQKIESMALQSDGSILLGGYPNALMRVTEGGVPDATFGSGGIVRPPFDGAVTGIAVQAEGKILVSGGVSGANPGAAVMRFNSNGTPDSSFATGGQFLLPGMIAKGLALQPGGGILAGFSDNANGGTGYFALRLSSDGVRDMTFGNSGTASFSASASIYHGAANRIPVAADGSFALGGYSAVGGFTLARFAANGQAHPSFAGYVGTPFGGLGSASDVALKDDGKALLVGYAGLSASDAMVVQINAAGALDTSFNDLASPVAGIAAAGLDCAGNTFPGGIAASPTGGVYLAYGGGCANGNLTLFRLDASGQTDTLFSDGISPGMSIFFFPGNATTSRAIAVQPDGRVVVGASINPAGTRDFALARVLPSGMPDTGFGIGGKLVFSPSGGADELYALALQPDGKILAAGSAGANGVVVRFNANGTLDAGFSGGVVTIPGAKVNVMVLQPDGAILAGVSPSAGGSAVYRLLASGQIDTAFGVNGSVTTADDFGTQGLAILSDGAIVAAGTNWIRKWSGSGVPRGFSAIAPQAVFGMTATAGDRILMLVPGGSGGATLRRLLASGAEDTEFSSSNVLSGLLNPGALGMAVQGTSVFVAGQKTDGYVPVVVVDNQATSTPTNPQEFQLDVAKNGSGRVTGSAIDCGAICSAMFNSGTTVTLTATPSANNTFTGWSGACTNFTGPCVVQMTAARTVTANFAGQQFQLSVDHSSTGNGTITIAPPGTDCTTSCQFSYAADTVVTLSATPSAGSRFAGWSGDCSNATGTCTVTMNRANLVVARFDEIPILTITRTGSGGGTVTSSPAGIACGNTCAFEFDFDAEVTLTAAGDSGSAFNGWSGACSGFGACIVTMNRARNVSANFTIGTASFSLSGPPEPHNFNAVSGALSTPRLFVLTNTGNLTLQGISATVVPNGFLWLPGTTCGTTLAPGESCNINLTLAPPPGTTAVQVNSVFRVQTANAGNSSDIPVAGVVVLPTVSVSPATLSFITQPNTTSVSQTVTFTAVDGALSQVAIVVGNSVFQKTSDTCTVAFLAAGQSCTATVTYSPSALGSNNGALNLETAANFGASMGRATLASAGLAGNAVAQAWTVTPSGGPNGSISPSIPTQVSNGSGFSLNIQANPGYEASITYVGDSCRGTTYDQGGGRYLYSTIGIAADCSISVIFAPFPDRGLTVGPGGNGTVTSIPPGLNCSGGGTGTCSASFPHGTVVTVIPTPATNWVVGGYAGCPVPAGTGNCTFTINANTFMNVGFSRVAVNLNVVKAGLGSGVVTSAQAGVIDCGSTCSASVPFGPNFTLTAVAAPGSTFRGFTGAGCSGSGDCNVQTGDDRTIVATFDLDAPTFTVTNTNASGPGSFMDVLSTIYQAGPDVCLPGAKTIAFNIPAATDPGCNAINGVCVVTVPENFNIRCADITIDGYTQPGAAPNTATDATNNAQIKIEFDGPGATSPRSVAIGRAHTHPFGNHTANNVTLRGIAFPRHRLDILAGNSGSVIGGGSGHVVAGNVFGWHADGTKATGVVSQGINITGAFLSALQIGGPSPADRNLLTHRDVAHCCEVGARGINGEGVTGSLFEGNYVNIGRDGLPVASNGTVQGIGVSGGLSGGTPYSTNNIIRRNVLANIFGTPVGTGGGTGNTVSENLMFGHPASLPGINFFDPSAGGSNPQLRPVVTAVTLLANATVVTGTVEADAPISHSTDAAADATAQVRLEFFGNAQAYDDVNGRAEVFLAKADLATDSAGCAAFAVSLPAGTQHVGVTATRLSSGDTSKFSRYVAPTAAASLSVTLAGTGIGSVTTEPPGILDCPAVNCSAVVAPGTLVRLVANLPVDSAFTSWAGPCLPSGGVCDWTAGGSGDFVATFKKIARLTLVNTTDVILGPVGPPCAANPGNVCRVYDIGTAVLLGEPPASGGAVFLGWDGYPPCDHPGTCQVTLDQSRTLTAKFSAQPQPAFAYISNQNSNNVSVVSAATNSVVATIPVGTTPIGVAVNPAGTRAYVVNLNSNNVSVISTATNAVIATIPVGNGPRGVAFNPAGTLAYVTNLGSDTVSVIDTATHSVAATFGVGVDPFSIALNAAGTRAYVGNFNSSSVSVIDTATNAVLANVPVGTSVLGVAVNPAGTRVYVAGMNASPGNFSVIDAASNTVIAALPKPNAYGVAVNPAGTLVYITYQAGNAVEVIDATTLTTVATIPVGTMPTGIAFSRDGMRAYVPNQLSNNVSVIDTATHTVIATVPVGSQPAGFGLFVGPAAPTPSPQVLTVTKTGTGTGAVVSVPAGINCGATCSTPFAQDSVVALTATPNAGSTFAGWSGACTGVASCSVTMYAARTVTAAFAVAPDTIPPVPQFSLTPATPRVGTEQKISLIPSTDAGGSGIDTYAISLLNCPGGCSAYEIGSGNGSYYADGGDIGFRFTPLATGEFRFAAIVTDKAGNTGTAQFSFNISPPTATAPAAPAITSATGGEKRVTVAFTTPADGGSAITSYTAVCGSRSVSGLFSPLIVTGLANGVAVSCTVRASNVIGNGPPSAAVSATPQSTLVLQSVVSQKAHGINALFTGIGTNFSLPVNINEPIDGDITVEPRLSVGGAHLLIFDFNTAVTSFGAITIKDASQANVGSVSASISGGLLRLSLHGIPDRKRVTITINDVNDSRDVSIAMGFLVGDSNGSGRVTAADVIVTKVKQGQNTTTVNFRNDFTLSGFISPSSLSLVKSRTGATLP